jgi:murein DD-endopeptidase MepM/ murein hydrolase activator NlpD
MSTHRPTARSAFFVLAAAVVLVVGVGTASGAVPGRIIFPVVGEAEYTDDFGDARWQGGHEGNDIVAEWRAPVIAVEAGRVVFWTKSASAGCMLYLYGKSGTSYRYIHLNNDLTPRNDNRGGCVPDVAFAPGLRDGQDVRAGQLIGYVGDSGDADGIHPHLHFELHPGDGAAVSPYRWLRRAERLSAPDGESEPTFAVLSRPRPVV